MVQGLESCASALSGVSRGRGVALKLLKVKEVTLSCTILNFVFTSRLNVC